MAGITKLDQVTDVFNGQADIIIFDYNGDYSDATFAKITASGKSVGQVVEDSTSWEGEAPSTNSINDEKGGVIVTNATAGTYAFACDVASLSDNAVKLFLNGESISAVNASTGLAAVGGSSAKITGVGFGDKNPVITRPIAIVNDEANKMILFPKAKIVGNLTLDSKLWRIHISATAQDIKTADLWTAMKINAKPIYGTE